MSVSVGRAGSWAETRQSVLTWELDNVTVSTGVDTALLPDQDQSPGRVAAVPWVKHGLTPLTSVTRVPVSSLISSNNCVHWVLAGEVQQLIQKTSTSVTWSRGCVREEPVSTLMEAIAALVQQATNLIPLVRSVLMLMSVWRHDQYVVTEPAPMWRVASSVNAVRALL